MDDLITNKKVKVIIGDYRTYNISKVLNSNKDKINKIDYFASAYIDEELVGSLRIKFKDDSYIIRDIFIIENKRNLGIGKKLMIETLKFLFLMKKPIILYVNPENLIAIKLYTKLGFILAKKNDKFGDRYEYRYDEENDNIRNILLKIFYHFVSDEEISKQTKIIIERMQKININVNRDIEMYLGDNYFVKFDKRTTDQKKYILTDSSLYLGKFPKEIIINNFLRKELPNNIIKINNYYFNNHNQILIMEYISLRLDVYLNQNINNTDILNDIFLQIFFIIAILQEKFKFMHKDLTTTNILLRPTNESIINYNMNNKIYSVKSHGYTPVLIDLASSTIFKSYDQNFIIYDTESLNSKYSHKLIYKKEDIITDINKYFWYNRDVNKFVEGYDIFTFINNLNKLNPTFLNINIIKKYNEIIKHYPAFSESYISPSEFLNLLFN
jgi:GNAT superfamily N-acetyltransferase